MQVRCTRSVARATNIYCCCRDIDKQWLRATLPITFYPVALLSERGHRRQQQHLSRKSTHAQAMPSHTRKVRPAGLTHACHGPSRRAHSNGAVDLCAANARRALRPDTPAGALSQPANFSRSIGEHELAGFGTRNMINSSVPISQMRSLKPARAPTPTKRGCERQTERV